ncbi:hypothetical protein KGQ27_03335 [Patescibacteria group bacterium]|nr:hypothetical protein [Patescibacteria group bacterium]MDE1946707.1 hypothetical protein [Patescibacteria group bacterium]MDE2010990.1 hypothetical protein [Patescibacteria group bacterium]MDE2232832.1 hypothetical protein [Patescibacteria group bacterium]
MNKKIIAIFGLTIVALAAVYLYSFGPLAGLRTALSINPASAKPIITSGAAGGTVSTASASTSAAAATSSPFGNAALVQEFRNRDMAQNHYRISIPADWHAGSIAPGKYAVSYSGGSGTIGLIDIPDNSTPELFILSQEEPALKKLPGYARVSYGSAKVNGNLSYKLVYKIYKTSAGGQSLEHERVYVTGQDHAALIDLSASETDWQRAAKVFDAVVGSFHWDQ